MKYVLALVLTVVLAGCGQVQLTQPVGTVSCEVNGLKYASGQANIPAGDGCNVCICGADGELACTEVACAVQDTDDSTQNTEEENADTPLDSPLVRGEESEPEASEQRGTSETTDAEEPPAEDTPPADEAPAVEEVVDTEPVVEEISPEPATTTDTVDIGYAAPGGGELVITRGTETASLAATARDLPELAADSRYLAELTGAGDALALGGLSFDEAATAFILSVESVDLSAYTQLRIYRQSGDEQTTMVTAALQ